MTVGGLFLLSKLRVIRTIRVPFIEALTAGDQKNKGAERNHRCNYQDHPHGWDPVRNAPLDRFPIFDVR
jgi:hypothetical protein